MKIKKIIIKNFKNMVEYTHNFDEKKEIIKAEFGGGKSTIFEAYKWVLGYDIPNFEPTIDRLFVKNLKTEVELIFVRENLEFSLYRSSIRKNGNVVNNFAYCGNPCKTLKAYKEKIEDLFNISHSELEILIDIKKFTNTDGAKWTWKEQREYLFKLLNIDLLLTNLLDNKKYYWIKEQFLKDRKLTELDILKKLAMDKRAIEKNIDANNAIYENNLTKIAQYKGIDFENLKKERETLEKELYNLENSSNKENKNAIVSQKLAEIDKLYTQLTNEELKISSQKSDKERKKVEFDRKLRELSVINSNLITEIKELDEKIQQLEEEKKQWANKTYDTSKNYCELCHAPLSVDKVNKNKTDFLNLQQSTLTELGMQISLLFNDKLRLNEKRKANKELYGGVKSELEQLIAEEIDETKVTTLKDEICKLKEEIKNLKMADINTEVENKINEIKQKISELNSQLHFESLIATLTAENQTLEERNRNLGVSEQKRLALEDLVNDFINEKMNIVSEVIKEKFKDISFQFFKYNRTDGEQKNICAVLYNGSDYSQCSFGQKIALNFYLNESLQNIYGCDFPIWVDDIGSAKIFESSHQFIGLFTDNSQKLNYVRIRDKYNLSDCEN